MGNRGGINRLAAILLVLIAIMLVLIAVPSYRVFQYRAQKTSCEQAMKSARDGLILEYLSRWDEGSVEDAIKTLDEVLPERPNICPAGGTVYLIKNSLGIFEPVCGLHDDDRRLRCRLNASRAMELLGTELIKIRKSGGDAPESLEITLNSRKLKCTRVRQKLELRRGTATTNGYKGVVAFYGIEGDGFKTGTVNKGEICYFVYADEDNASVWLAGDGWTGSAYQGMEKK